MGDFTNSPGVTMPDFTIPIPSPAASVQQSKTADFVITGPGYFDNAGATGPITGTFDNNPGLEAIIARVDNFEVRVLPPVGQQILWSYGRVAVDKYLVIATGLGVIRCLVSPSGDLQVEIENGNGQEQ